MTPARPPIFDTPEPSKAHGHSRSAEDGDEYEGGRSHRRETDESSTENVTVRIPTSSLARLKPLLWPVLFLALGGGGGTLLPRLLGHDGAGAPDGATGNAAILKRLDELAAKVEAEPVANADPWQARTILGRLDKLEAQVGTLNTSMAAYSASMTAMANATEKAIDRLDRANDARRLGR